MKVLITILSLYTALFSNRIYAAKIYCNQDKLKCYCMKNGETIRILEYPDGIPSAQTVSQDCRRPMQIDDKDIDFVIDEGLTPGGGDHFRR